MNLRRTVSELNTSTRWANWMQYLQRWQNRGLRGGGYREIGRRRAQIERGQLTPANGLVLSETTLEAAARTRAAMEARA